MLSLDPPCADTQCRRLSADPPAVSARYEQLQNELWSEAQAQYRAIRLTLLQAQSFGGADAAAAALERLLDRSAG